MNQHVRLKSFNGTADKPAEQVKEHENYWKLIGFEGQIIADERVYSQTFKTTERLRVLVRFHDNIQDMGLASHNEKSNRDWGNSLWILKDDLEFIDAPNASINDLLISDVLIHELQCLAREGGNICQLVQKIREHDNYEPTAFFVMTCFMKAFGISYSDVRKLPGAECVGGAAYSNDEIDEMILPIIRAQACL